MSIKDKISEITSSLPDGVRLVAVSKFHPAQNVQEAYNAGQRIFGESRVQELVEKQAVLPSDIEWHFIGTLQINKVKYITPFISMIQSVDTLKLLKEIDRQAEKSKRVINVLLEVHIAEEESKHGFSIDECKALFCGDLQTSFPHVKICGLMGMATFTDNISQVEGEFKKLHCLFEEIKLLPQTDKTTFKELSMGMSDDYKLAIGQGSTIVRIGTAIFGERH
ncbi:MAG: YggS family pyridoxal phosphate-dependent enzyme [Tannerella sp.]|jgi:pyridoxal phosphate enzyme (YggS family)|nr:YggS family pyridoxal phosphate-dependent enzyme [Tannerella sp.]